MLNLLKIHEIDMNVTHDLSAKKENTMQKIMKCQKVLVFTYSVGCVSRSNKLDPLDTNMVNKLNAKIIPY